jgi:hypothetical protein
VNLRVHHRRRRQGRDVVERLDAREAYRLRLLAPDVRTGECEGLRRELRRRDDLAEPACAVVVASVRMPGAPAPRFVSS